jgi:hypothetical protein
MNNIDYIESPLTDIINKYISAIIGNNIDESARIIIYNGYIFIILFDTVIYRVFAKEIDTSLTYGFIASENTIPGDKYKINIKKTKVDISLCESTLRSIDIEENILAKVENAKITDKAFEKVSQIKAENGCIFYKLIGFNGKPYYIPIMSSFPKLAKSDDIDIYVYKNINDNESYLVREIIHKSSLKCDYNVFFRTLKFT